MGIIGIQRPNRKLRTRYPNSSLHHHPPWSLIRFRTANTYYIMALTASIRSSPAQGPTSWCSKPRYRSDWIRDSQTCLWNCQDQALRIEAVGLESARLVQECYCPGQVDWSQGRELRLVDLIYPLLLSRLLIAYAPAFMGYVLYIYADFVLYLWGFETCYTSFHP